MDLWAINFLLSLAWLLNGWREAFCYFQLSKKSYRVSEEKPLLQVSFISWREFCLTPFGVYAIASLISCNIICVVSFNPKCHSFAEFGFDWRPNLAVLNAVRRSSGVVTLLAS